MKKIVGSLMVAAVLAATACAPLMNEMTNEEGKGYIGFYHDTEHSVSCWYMLANGSSVFCLPDAQVKGLSR